MNKFCPEMEGAMIGCSDRRLQEAAGLKQSYPGPLV